MHDFFAKVRPGLWYNAGEANDGIDLPMPASPVRVYGGS
jgi:hypothetical protein